MPLPEVRILIPAEFEEKTYEGTLYNQFERGQRNLFTPGQVMEGAVGFDRGLFLSQVALWQTLGYKAPLHGAALAYYDWPITWGPARPRSQLPNFKLNLFLQTKRPEYYKRRPRSVVKLPGTRAPLWAFHTRGHQQKLLEVLAETTQGRAHVAYACAAFHTNAALFAHMKTRTIVENSTFPSVSRLSGHNAWYYWSPGASGAANPDPENIEEPSLFDRIRTLARENSGYEPGDLTWLDVTAREVIASVLKLENQTDAVSAHFLDDLQTLSRFAERYDIQPSFLAYAQISLFSIRFDLNWLLVTDTV
jgi:hypothetical protein